MTAGPGPDAAAGDALSATSSVAHLRREVGDLSVPRWTLTAARIERYALGLRALTRAGVYEPAVAAEDAGQVLDPDQEPALRPWDGPLPGGADPVAVVVRGLRARPATADVIARVLPLDEFVATHLTLGVCVVALAVVAGVDATAWRLADVRRWAATVAVESDAEREFVENVVCTLEHRGVVEAAFDD